MVQQEHRVLWENRVLRVQQELRVLLEKLAQLVIQDQLAQPVKKVIVDLLVREHLVLFKIF